MPLPKPRSQSEMMDEWRGRYAGNLYAFAEEMLAYEDMHPPLHERMCRFVSEWDPKKYIKVMLVPREHLKSTIASVSYPIHCFAHQRPGYRIMMTHGIGKIGRQYMREVQGKMKIAELQALYPGRFWARPTSESPMWHQDQIVMPGNDDKVPSLMMTSEGTSTTGFHFDLIICDDLVHKDNVTTEELRTATKKYFHGLVPQLLAGGRILVVGTRWSNDDLYGYLLDPENPYHKYVDSLVLDCGWPNEPIFPPRRPDSKVGFTLETLEQRRGGMDPYSWSCQYMNDPTPQEQQYFPRCNLRFFDFIPGTTQPPTDVPIWYYTAVDPNRSLKTKNDPAVVMTVGIDANGHYWVVEVSRGHPSGPELVNWVASHAQRWNPRSVLVESVGFQNQLAEWLKQDMVAKNHYYTVVPVERGPVQKIERVTKMQPMVAQGRLHIRNGYDILVQELEFYPDWKHDDQCDALSDIFARGKAPPKEDAREAPTNPYLIDEMVSSHVGVQRVAGGVRRGQRYVF